MQRKGVQKCPKVVKDFLKILLTLDVDKFRAVILKMTEIHEQLVKKETSDKLSSRILLND